MSEISGHTHGNLKAEADRGLPKWSHADIVTGEIATCIHCDQRIGAVIDPYCRLVDWGSYLPGFDEPEDFGCPGPMDAFLTVGAARVGHDPGPGHTPGLRSKPAPPSWT